MSHKGPRPKPAAVAYLRANPEALSLSDTDLARRLKHLGFYSGSTYEKDIRIKRLRDAVREPR